MSGCATGRLPAEEVLLERLQQLFPAERLHLRDRAVAFGHDAVVLQRRVRDVDAVVELVALPDVVVRARLVRGAMLRVDGTTDRPQRAGATLDPDDDPLVATGVVATDDDPFGETTARLRLHVSTIQSPSCRGSRISFATRSRSCSRARRTRIGSRST